jgi:iron(III) transport system permease protein
VVAFAPVPALVAAAWIDRGPDGFARLSVFPAALAALDPYLWDACRNSLVMSAVVTLAARFLGVGLARVAARWRFWGRTPLIALALAGVEIGPTFGAIGARSLLGAPERWGLSGSWARVVPWVSWVVWFWVALASAVPLVAVAAADALARVDPLWVDAARLCGASPRRVWRQVVGPIVRPEVARALGAVFTLTLLEPGAPLVLGLRRTLGYQTAESALSGSPEGLTRSVVLALGATLIAALVRLLIVWRAGPCDEVRRDEPLPTRRPIRADWGRSIALVALFGLAAICAWLPAAGLLAVALRDGGPWGSTPSAARLSVQAFVQLVRDPLTRGYLVNSAFLAVGALTLDLVLARGIASWVGTRPGGRRLDRLASWPEALPPLALGVAVLALPVTLRAAAELLPTTQSSPTPRDLLPTMVDLIDPERTPWVALVVAVALVRLPSLAREAVERRRLLRPEPLEAALGFGASHRQAARTIPGRWLGVSRASAFAAWALVATNVTPALLLAPTADSRPLGPAVLTLIDEPGTGLARASALAMVGVTLNLSAFFVASLRRPR